MSMTDSNFNCSQCKVKHRGSEKRQELLFKQKNCREIAPNPNMQYNPEHTMKGSARILYHTCPANFNNSGTAVLINYLDQYSKGIMPYAGGLLEQPAKFVEIMDLVHNLNSEHQIKREAILSKRYKR